MLRIPFLYYRQIRFFAILEKDSVYLKTILMPEITDIEYDLLELF